MSDEFVAAKVEAKVEFAAQQLVFKRVREEAVKDFERWWTAKGWKLHGGKYLSKFMAHEVWLASRGLETERE